MKQEDFDKLSTDDQIAYFTGRLLLAIGKGKMQDEVFFMMDYFTRTGYARGYTDASKSKTK
jgi:hypothetical protein